MNYVDSQYQPCGYRWIYLNSSKYSKCVCLFLSGLQPVMADEGYVVRIRGLPWSCSVDEVQRFFSGKHFYVIFQKTKCYFIPIVIEAFFTFVIQVAKFSTMAVVFTSLIQERGAPAEKHLWRWSQRKTSRWQ